MNYWTEGDWDSDLGVTCNFDPVCPFHEKKKTSMVVNNCKLLNFSLREDEDWDSHALDVVFECPYCGYKDIFGVAISREHHQKVVAYVNDQREKGIGEHEIFQAKRDQEFTGEAQDESWLEAYT